MTSMKATHVWYDLLNVDIREDCPCLALTVHLGQGRKLCMPGWPCLALPVHCGQGGRLPISGITCWQGKRLALSNTYYLFTVGKGEDYPYLILFTFDFHRLALPLQYWQEKRLYLSGITCALLTRENGASFVKWWIVFFLSTQTPALTKKSNRHLCIEKIKIF